MANQSHGSSLWREPANSGAVPTAQKVVFQFTGTKWVPVVATAAQGRLLDVRGTGKYTLIDVRTEYVLATVSGSKVTPTAGGIEAAVMALIGAKFVAVAVGAGVKAAQFFTDACRGKLRLVSFTAPEAFLVLVRGKAHCY